MFSKDRLHLLHQLPWERIFLCGHFVQGIVKEIGRFVGEGRVRGRFFHSKMAVNLMNSGYD